MFDFCCIAPGLYALYRGGLRVSLPPLSREELDAEILALPISDAEQAAIDYFCN